MVLAFIVVFVGAIVVFVERLGAAIFGIVAIHVMMITPHAGCRTAASVTMTSVTVGFLTFSAAVVTTVSTAF